MEYQDFLQGITIGTECSIQFHDLSNESKLIVKKAKVVSLDGNSFRVRFWNGLSWVPISINEVGFGSFLGSPCYMIPARQEEMIDLAQSSYPLAAMETIVAMQQAKQ